MPYYYKVTFQPLVQDRRCQTFETYFELIDALTDYGFRVEDTEQEEARYDWMRCKARWMLTHSEHISTLSLRNIFADPRHDFQSLRVSEVAQ